MAEAGDYITIIAVPGYRTTVPRQLLTSNNRSRFGDILRRHPSQNTYYNNQSYITPTTLLVLQYKLTGSILMPGDTTMYPNTVRVVQRFREKGYQINDQKSVEQYLGLENLQLDMKSIQPIISDQIVLFGPGDQRVTFDGQSLFDMSSGGLMSDLLRLAPGVMSIELPREMVSPKIMSAMEALSVLHGSDPELVEASRYFLIPELANSVVQSVLACPLSESIIEDPIEIYSIPWMSGVQVSRRAIMEMFPESMLSAALELDPRAIQIPIENPRITMYALDAISKILVLQPLPDMELVENALGIHELTNPYLPLLIQCRGRWDTISQSTSSHMSDDLWI